MTIKLAALGLPALLIASGCGGDGPTDPGSPEPVDSVSVSPPQHQMGVGESHPFTVTLRSASGRVLTGRGVTWVSGGETVAAVTASGMVTGVGEGSTEIIASSEGRSGSALEQVTAAPGSEGPVTRVVVDPDTADLEEGEGTELTATALDAEGREVIGRAVQWSTKDDEVVLVSPAGVVTTLRPGTAEVTARVDGVTGSATIRVTASYDFDVVYDGWGGVAGVAPELFLLDVRDPEPAPARILPAGTEAVDPAPSPDGTQRIAYSHSESGMGHIYTMAPDGTDVRQLTAPTDAYDDEPAWSPDGSVIAFVRFGPASGSELWLVPPAGGERVFLHLGGTQFAPAWSPDGRIVAFVSRHDGQAVFDVYTVWADGTRVARRTADGIEARNPAWIVR